MRVHLYLLAGLFALAAALTGPAYAAGPLQTAVAEHGEFERPDVRLALERIRAAGATAFRTDLDWYRVAPVTKPTNFRADDHTDPAYRWQRFDQKVQLLQEYGLQPIVAINYPPTWARGNARSVPVDYTEWSRFLRAAAERYSGRTPGIPRIRHWQIWIEPNVNKFFNPQFSGRRLIAPVLYRRVVNLAAQALHRVRSDNVVIAGGLSPFTVKAGETRAIGPLRFMRAMLCMSKGRTPKPTCSARSEFDVWAHHPYTSGGPMHTAYHADDVSLGDLPEMRRLLQAAVKARRIVSPRPVGFWVTEFSWDTNPPDRKALPANVVAQWTAEALYRMWTHGVTLVTWLQLRDGEHPGNDVQSGLYYRGQTLARDRAKPGLAAFRFPFVAFPQRGGLFTWGRTPRGRPGQGVIERRVGNRWTRVASFQTNGNGIFSQRLPLRLKRGYFRARLASGGEGGGVASLAFSLVRPRDRFVNPFGGG